MSLLLLKLPTLYSIPGGINYTETTMTARYTTVHVVRIHSQVKAEFPLSIMKKIRSQLETREILRRL